MLIIAFLLLMAGILNYYFLRGQIHLPVPALSIRLSGQVQNGPWAQFKAGYLSDWLWCSSLLLVTVVFSERYYLHFRHRIFILLLPFATETAQLFAVINGTFDCLDMVTYGVTELVFLIVFPTLLSSRHEQ